MRTDTVVRARIDGETKARATEALKAMGLSVSDVIRMVLLRVAEEKRLPFVVRVPNAATIEAMRELDDGRGQRCDTAEELFRDLEICHADPGSIFADSVGHLRDMTPSLAPAGVLEEVSRTYNRRVMNNVHRSHYVEAIVALVLRDSGWRRMTPWDSWDCEHESLVRLEVKQSAFAQGWGRNRSSAPRFDIAPRTGYWEGDGARWVEQMGRHAEIYVFAWHEESSETADQRDPGGWKFYVVQEPTLPAKQKTIGLNELQRRKMSPCGVEGLAAAVGAIVGEMHQRGWKSPRL